jgi:hypothetical protein
MGVYEQHEEGTVGFGQSKAQHFIEHIRSVDTSHDGWRDKQEAMAEAAQMAVCDELSCSVCADTCRTLTQYHWDINRIAHKQIPVNPTFNKLHGVICDMVAPVLTK